MDKRMTLKEPEIGKTADIRFVGGAGALRQHYRKECPLAGRRQHYEKGL